MKGTLYPILIAVGLLGTLATPLADDRPPASCYADTRAASEFWPGWRGAAAFGKAAGPLPTQCGVIVAALLLVAAGPAFAEAFNRLSREPLGFYPLEVGPDGRLVRWSS